MLCVLKCHLADGWECGASDGFLEIGGYDVAHFHTCGDKTIGFDCSNTFAVYYNDPDRKIFVIWNEWGAVTRERDLSGVVKLTDNGIKCRLPDGIYRASRETVGEYRQALMLLPQPIYEEIIGFYPLFGIEEWQRAAAQRYPQSRADKI